MEGPEGPGHGAEAGAAGGACAGSLCGAVETPAGAELSPGSHPLDAAEPCVHREDAAHTPDSRRAVWPDVRGDAASEPPLRAAGAAGGDEGRISGKSVREPRKGGDEPSATLQEV
ncbi:hypothetical protein NQD34_001499 [Periophthalmus magnuspinnatus]|nr:hypothetical protein NQD34_001499 [Periophthalmus magnuspinnatus]